MTSPQLPDPSAPGSPNPPSPKVTTGAAVHLLLVVIATILTAVQSSPDVFGGLPNWLAVLIGGAVTAALASIAAYLKPDPLRVPTLRRSQLR